MNSAAELLEVVLAIQAEIRDAVIAACEAQSVEDASAVAAEEDDGDTIYAIDRVSEELLIARVEERIARCVPVRLVAEGIPDGAITLPRDTPAGAVAWRIIVDPIDGTRGLMYQKRPGWILTGIAPERGDETSLRDIQAAAMTEIPLVKQHLSDVLWAERGCGARAQRVDRIRGTRHDLTLRPSRATSIAHGFAMISRFFPGARDELAAIDEDVVRDCLGPVQRGKAHCFEDQYICSGGQLAELILGHDRFCADLRPLIEPLIAARGLALGICCHPYDLCSVLVAEECGVVVTDAAGRMLDAPLAVEPDVAWVGYANPAIRAEVEPALQRALTARGLMENSHVADPQR